MSAQKERKPAVLPTWPEQASLKNWGEPPTPFGDDAGRNVTVDCGWGRLIFGQTFEQAELLAHTIAQEAADKRDVAIYVREPHVVLAAAPQSLFLDPSHTYRLDLANAENPAAISGLTVRRANADDLRDVNRLYRSRKMVPVSAGAVQLDDTGCVRMLIAEEASGGETRTVGAVMGVDHVAAFADPDNGSSLWALAVDPQAQTPGIGRLLVETLAASFADDGRAFMDLSVMHDNEDAIALYDKLGFERIPVYAIKRKNPINENLFVGPNDGHDLNIYADIIIQEARRRGILVEIEDAEAGLFRLTHGGRSISCRESLSDLTSAVALSRCDDKALTRRLLERAGLRVPDQIVVRPGDATDEIDNFFSRYDRVVVKPAQGEQGQGVFVDLTSREAIDEAIEAAGKLCDRVLLEEMVKGDDLRIIVIGGEVVAAAIRKPAEVRGDGERSIRDLIEKQSRRRMAATGGESAIPLDNETERCIAEAGYTLDDVLAAGEVLRVRKTANLHTGGTIHDVTPTLDASLRSAAISAAEELRMPVVGFDFMVRDPEQPEYAIIEANERPGLANHEPQPTAERFIDLLFPHTRGR